MTAQFQVLIGSVLHGSEEKDVVGIIHDHDTGTTEYLTPDGEILDATDVGWFSPSVLEEVEEPDPEPLVEHVTRRVTTSEDM